MGHADGGRSDRGRMTRIIFWITVLLLSAAQVACVAGAPRHAHAGPVTTVQEKATRTANGAHERAVKPMVRFSVKGRFDDIRSFLELAITDRGMVINNVAHIGTMLDRTGKDIGASKRVYLHAEAIEFCSATLSRRMMEANPDNIVFCPYIIALYVLPDSPGVVHIAYRRPPRIGTGESQAALHAVDTLLREIVRDAIGE